MSTIINDICGGGTNGTTPKNTGGKKQSVEAPVRTYALAKEGFAFASAAEARTKAAWDTAKANKDIVVFYDVEELEPANKEAVKKEGRYRDYNIKDAQKGVNYKHTLSTCSHEAVKSYEDSNYTRIFRITDDNEILCEAQADGSVKGEPMNSFIVGTRDDAPVDGTPMTSVSIIFENYVLSVLIAAFELVDLEGIYDVDLELVSATATVIKFKAVTSCCGTLIESFEDGDFQVKDAGGADQAGVLTGPDGDGVYTLTGTGYATGFTVEVVDVVVQTDIMFEGTEPLAITV